jgi:inorganic pyrophosphatase
MTITVGNGVNKGIIATVFHQKEYIMSYNNIPPGKDAPHDIYVVIEIPANHDPIKYEIDKDSDALFVDRFMGTAMFYPANYGYIPNTLSEDGDALDVLVVTPYPVAPGSVIRCRPVGKLNMEDESGIDAKLIAVPHEKLTPIYKNVKEYTDLPELLINQIRHFFETYKALEPGKWVKVTGWEGADVAKAEVLKSIEAAKK